MARTVNMHEAKTHLSKLVKEVAGGEEVVIARGGDPVAKLVPYSESSEPRVPGGWEGQVWIAPDFDEVSDELLAAFYGDEE